MPKATRPKDPMQLAKIIGEIATGERPNDKSEFLPKKPAIKKDKKSAQKKK